MEQTQVGNGGSPWDPLVRVAAAIAGGVGVLGFVALAGGAVLWTRFDAAGFPTERALAVVPRTELIVIGAETLVPLAALVLVSVVLIWLAVATWLLIATRDVKAEDRRSERAERIRGASWPVRAVIGLSLAATLAYFLLYAPAPDFRDVLVAVLVLLVAGFVCERGWAILCDESFGWFAILVGAVIFGVGLSLTYLETQERPLVRPAAVVFKGSHRGVAGLFIAETDSAVYVAEVSPKSDNGDEGDEPTGRMIEIPRDLIRAISIGSNQSLPQALTRAPTLRRELDHRIPGS
jgi:hypothetical protein